MTYWIISIRFITGNRRVISERIGKMIDLADKVLPHSKELSRAITDAGFKGVVFGSALKELSNWYYKQVANNKIPSNEDVKKLVSNINKDKRYRCFYACRIE